jgi:hypothetical protein
MTICGGAVRYARWSGGYGRQRTGRPAGFAEPVVPLRIADRSQVHRPLRARWWRHAEACGLSPRREPTGSTRSRSPLPSGSSPLAEASSTPVTPSRSSSSADLPTSATPGTGTLPGLASTVRQSLMGEAPANAPAIAPGSGAARVPMFARPTGDQIESSLLLSLSSGPPGFVRQRLRRRDGRCERGRGA